MKNKITFATILYFISVLAIGISIYLNGLTGVLSAVSAISAAGYMYWAMSGEQGKGEKL